MYYMVKKLIRNRAISIVLAVLMTIFAGCASNKIVKQENKDVDNPPKAKLITEISTTEGSESINVLVRGSRLLAYTSVKQPFPLGVILYFPDTALGAIDTIYSPDSDIIALIKTSKLTAKGQTARMEIALNKDVPYKVTREGTGLKICFSKASDKTSSAKTAGEKPEGAILGKAEQIEEIDSKSLTEHEIQSASAATQLDLIKAIKNEENTVINVKADGMIKDYKTFTINSPAQIIFDIFNLKSPHKNQELVSVNSRCVKRIRHYCFPDRLRVIIETNKMYLSEYKAESVKNGLLIRVGPKAGIAASEIKIAENISANKMSMPEKTQKEPEVKPEQPSWINRIEFLSEEAGKSTVYIGTTHPVQYKIKKGTDKKLFLELLNTRLPDYRKRPLITTRFQSAVDRITPVQTAAMKNKSLLVIELRESVPYRTDQKDNLLMVHFDPSSVSPQPMKDAKLPSWEKVMAQAAVNAGEDSAHQVVDVGNEAYSKKAVQTVPYNAENQREYHGKKIALDFYDTDIKNVFRILMDVSGKNFAIDNNVNGKVTLSIEKPVPWEQIIDLVLRMNDLGSVSKGHIVRIATLETLKKEDDLRREKLAAEQKAAETFEPLFTEYIPVSYANASTEVAPHIEKILTDKRGRVSVDERNNMIILTDVSEKIQRAKEIVNKIDKVTPQVVIEARIVEANSTFSRELGTDWFVAGDTDSSALGGLLGYSMAVNFPGSMALASNFGQLGINFSRLIGSRFLLDARLKAMESQGQGKIISAPKIITLDNKEAVIKQILEYPHIKEIDEDENKIRYELKPLELALTVTPHVTPDDRISLKLQVDKDDLGNIINDWQSYISKEAVTELLVNDGETVVIGGIFKTSKDESVTGYPLLKNIPILGWLFKSEEKVQRNEELLIFISPKIVKLEQRTLHAKATESNSITPIF